MTAIQFHINRIIQYIVLCVLLLLLNIIFLYPSTLLHKLFIFIIIQYQLHEYNRLFCAKFFVNIHFFFHLSWCIPKSQIAGCSGKCIFVFVKNHQIVFQNVCSILNSQTSTYESSSCFTFLKTCGILCLFQ